MINKRRYEDDENTPTASVKRIKKIKEDDNITKVREIIEQEIGYRGFGLPHATHIYHMYKVRFGSYPQNIKIWVNVDLGTGRMTDCFASDWQNKVIKVPKTELRKS